MATGTQAASFKDMGRYGRRRRSSVIAMTLCFLSTALGLAVLAIILGTLVVKGIGGMNLAVFTQNTPPPGSAEGGLLNAILGSLLMTVIGVGIGTPVGILAGTYMAEYGRQTRLTQLVRFINDILLSAPSIVMGLFVYAIMVKPMGHFSGFAGAIVLAVLVIPIVVRTTENMLLLVPDQLREASSALGLPKAYVVRHVTYKAASAGIMTGVLLAVARISGETAPLLFTALNNQFTSWAHICGGGIWSWIGVGAQRCVDVPDLNAPLASLPAVIFQFALSPYADWQRLAWTGALLITAAVLTLSVLARWLGSQTQPE